MREMRIIFFFDEKVLILRRFVYNDFTKLQIPREFVFIPLSSLKRGIFLFKRKHLEEIVTYFFPYISIIHESYKSSYSVLGNMTYIPYLNY